MKNYIGGFPELDALELHFDRTDDEPASYAVMTSGLVKLGEDILGNETWQYNAVLQSREYTADDLSRLNASAFTETFTFWISRQNSSGSFPELPDGMYPESISADNGMLLALDEDGDRGVYQIQIHLTFRLEE
ncbi:hypothetical protein [Ruminococcus sp. YE71]|uniref:hypothetical protein n=2 Tax=unclassified Ruminococcus TaxID=2608920 RepID=UPI0009309D4B|nr:hypothetical protein [Ruminococcus sp. YE71]